MTSSENEKSPKKKVKRYSVLGEEELTEYYALRDEVRLGMKSFDKEANAKIKELIDFFSPEGELNFLRKFIGELRRRSANFEGEWVTKDLPDLSGMQQYTVCIRSYIDPERMPRELMKRDTQAKWLKELMKQPVEAMEVAVMAHMADGQARTFNRIGVEMMDKTADLILGTPFEEAMWSLVAKGELAFTMVAPVFFRKVPEPQGIETQAIADQSQDT